MQKNEQGVKRPKIIGLSHMAFQAHDIEKTLAFYKDILGYEDVVCLSGTDDEPERIFIRISGTQFIELQPEREPMTDRLIQFGFIVEDIEALQKYLASRGVAVPKATSIGSTGNPRFHLKDPDGHVVEFLQYIPDGWPLRTAGKMQGTNYLSTCLMHIGFTVYSLERSLAFYRDILDFTEIWRGSSDNKKLDWVQLRLPEDKNYIELMLYDDPLSIERLGVLNHYGLEVPSVPAAVESLTKLPAFSSYPRAVVHKIGTCRHRLSNLFDPDGTRVELMERATFDGSVTPSSAAPPPR